MRRIVDRLSALAALLMVAAAGAFADQPQPVAVPPNLSLHGADTIDCVRGSRQAATLLASETLTLACSLAASPTGQIDFELRVCQDAIGGRTLTWNNSNLVWSSGVAPTMPSAAGACLNERFRYDGASFYDLAPPAGATMALPVTAANGGTGDSVGRVTKTNGTYTNGPNGTTLNELAEFTYTNVAAPALVQEFNGTATGHTAPIGVVTAGAGTSGTPTIVHNGLVAVDFDGQTTAADIATYSTSSATHTMHDCGVTQSSKCTTAALGVILTANSGAGTNSNVNLTMNAPVPSSLAAKLITGGNTTVTAQTGTPPAQNLWTTIASATIPAMPGGSPGIGNMESRLIPGSLGVFTLDAVPTDLCCELSVASLCASGAQTQIDSHCLGAAYLATLAPNTSYQHIPFNLAIANWQGSTTSDNPLSCGSTTSLKCVSAGNNITVLTAQTGVLGLADDGTQSYVMEMPLMGGVGQ
ncbi:MAG TPA: hypothetical protein VKS22_16295 [Candidatus Binataceae bacterium]|nr:hypothetical protein [Candidatus Binataceae bacterium]